MKKVVYLIMLIAVSFVSCLDKNDNSEVFYESFGVVKETVAGSGKMYVHTDRGNKINPNVTLNQDDKDRRVYMIFTATEDPEKADTINAFVRKFLRITQLNVQSEGADTLGTDKIIKLREIWTAQNYLTFSFDVSAASENSLTKHKYALLSDLAIVNDTVRADFRYSRNNDQGSQRFNKLVAIKLEKLFDPQKSVVLAIKYDDAESTEKIKYVKYPPITN
jgi:hypothetical protein